MPLAGSAFDFHRAPDLLTVTDLARIFRVGTSQAYRKARRGDFDVFLVRPALGPARYSKTRVMAYVQGEPTFEVLARRRA